MALCLLSCGIFEAELEKILEVDNLGQQEKPQIKYTLPALHVDYDGLKKGITDGLEEFKGEKTTVLYGSMCHPDLAEIVQPYHTNYPEQGNCIDLFIKPEHKKEIEKGENVFYLTVGWLQNWKKVFQQGQGWDEIDARQSFGFYDKIVLLDSGVITIEDEDLLEFFEYTQVPIEIEPIDLDYFKHNVSELCQKTNSK